jgi:TetR/AcrR family transcriptional regulator, transcriptional repressor for nem operon
VGPWIQEDRGRPQHELFKRALTRYVETMTTAHLETLEDQARPAIDRIRALLDEVVDSEEENRRSGHSGCLTNTTVEFAGRVLPELRTTSGIAAARVSGLRGVTHAAARRP